eukprot:scaffold141301_cov18-Prasinocladus_malaysianus.AAC.1
MSARIIYCFKVNLLFTLAISDVFANVMHANEVASSTSIIINNHRGIAFTPMRGKNIEQSTLQMVPIPIFFCGALCCHRRGGKAQIRAKMTTSTNGNRKISSFKQLRCCHHRNTLSGESGENIQMY